VQDFFRTRQRLFAQLKIIASTFFLPIHESGSLEDLQVFGHRREGYRQTFGQLADAAPFPRDPAQQLAPVSAAGQGSKDRVRNPPLCTLFLLPNSLTASGSQQVEERKNKNPNKVDKMPVQA
jgi:hypothetical protein